MEKPVARSFCVPPGPEDDYGIITPRLNINYKCLANGSGIFLTNCHKEINPLLLTCVLLRGRDLLAMLWHLTPLAGAGISLDLTFFLPVSTLAFLPSCHRPKQLYPSTKISNTYLQYTEGHPTSGTCYII